MEPTTYTASDPWNAAQLTRQSKREADKALARHRENTELGKALGRFFVRCCLSKETQRKRLARKKLVSAAA